VGLRARLLRALLRVLSLGYRVTISLRNRLYDQHLLRSHRVSIPVICIGNLTTGGTGKTPLVVWLCDYLSNRYTSCAILTRGYKTHHTEADEPALLHKHCPTTHLVVNSDRVAGARQAISGYDAQVLVMDDGFQHRRLARDLDIITLDATLPFGYDHLLPAGLLREPVTALQRAGAVVITRSDQVQQTELQTIQQTITQINPSLIVAHAEHRPTAVRYGEDQIMGLEALNQRRVFAFCGIGNPDVFFTTLRQLGAAVVGTHIFNDHYHCTASDLQDIAKQAQSHQAEIILTTEKNFFHIRKQTPEQGLILGYLEISLAFTCAEEPLKQLIEQTLAGRIRQ
jgi:tetraacyldisaccharide 4'-kinase